MSKSRGRPAPSIRQLKPTTGRVMSQQEIIDELEDERDYLERVDVWSDSESE